MELSEFLLARITEDEAVAAWFRNDFGDVKPWRCDEIGGKVRQVGPTEFGLPDVIAEADTHLVADHIARHDPARVLAECMAKRRIVDHHAPQAVDEFRLCVICTETGPDAQEWPCLTLRLLAAPYADHPDYRDEWKP